MFLGEKFIATRILRAVSQAEISQLNQVLAVEKQFSSAEDWNGIRELFCILKDFKWGQVIPFRKELEKHPNDLFIDCSDTSLYWGANIDLTQLVSNSKTREDFRKMNFQGMNIFGWVLYFLCAEKMPREKKISENSVLQLLIKNFGPRKCKEEEIPPNLSILMDGFRFVQKALTTTVKSPENKVTAEKKCCYADRLLL